MWQSAIVSPRTRAATLRSIQQSAVVRYNAGDGNDVALSPATKGTLLLIR